MPFLQSQQHKTNKSTAHSLRAYLKVQQDDSCLSWSWLLKRASSIISNPSGSMTLEAAFVLPFFMLAVINILFAVSIIGLQSRMNAALHQVGNRMAFAGYVCERTVVNALPDSLAGVLISQEYARSQVIKYIGSSYLEKSCVVNGTGGVSFAASSVMQSGDIIDLQVSYRVQPFTALMGFEEFAMTQRYYGRAWTGYDVTQGVSDESGDDPMVYITETGTVYHVNRGCVYLNPSIESLPRASVDGSRNQSGGKYYPCEMCGAGTDSGEVYITSQGSRYHVRLNCSGLKRTIYTVPLSEVGGRGRCSKCG